VTTGHITIPSPDEPIRLNEVGAYGDLRERPNPDGLVVLTVPPFESMLPFIAQRPGRELSTDEIEAERNRAPSIVLTNDTAQHMAAGGTNRV